MHECIDAMAISREINNAILIVRVCEKHFVQSGALRVAFSLHCTFVCVIIFKWPYCFAMPSFSSRRTWRLCYLNIKTSNRSCDSVEEAHEFH